MDRPSVNIVLPLVILSTVAVGTVLTVLHSILVPLILAGFLSIIFKPLVAFVRRLGAPTWVGLLGVLIVTGGAIYATSVIVSWGVASAVEKAPEYSDRVMRMIGRAESLIAQYGGSVDATLLERLQEVVSAEKAVALAGSWVGSALTVLTDGTLVLLFLIFMVLGGDTFSRKLQAAFHGSAVNALRIYETLNMKVLRYLRLKTIINLFTGLVVYGVLEAFGVDFAPVMGLLAFLFNYIPNIGSFIMTALPGVIAAIQFENVGYALIIVAVLIVVQNLIGNILEPKLMGSSLDLSPVVVLFALVFWGWMWGIVGMILSVPIMAVIKTLMEQFPTTQPLAILMGSSIPKEFR